MPVDYFETDDSAPFVTYFAGTVTESYGDTPANQAVAAGRDVPDFDGADKTRIYWSVSVDDILQDWDNVPPESITKNWGIGKDWWADETGLILRHKDDPGDEAVEAGKAKPILFKEDSAYGMLLALIRGARKDWETQGNTPLVLDGGGKVEYDMRGLAAWFRQNGVYDSRDASIWVGHKFLFRGLGLIYRNTKGKPGATAMPVKWLGYGDVSDSPSSTAAAQGASSAPLDPADVAGTLPPHTAPELVEQVASLASNATSFNDFRKQALMLPEVKEDEELRNVIMDQSNGPWSVR
jgi:hypothetical protein